MSYKWTPEPMTQEELRRHLEQIGIDIRHRDNHQGMRDYMRHLREELAMTEAFLVGCAWEDKP